MGKLKLREIETQLREEENPKPKKTKDPVTGEETTDNRSYQSSPNKPPLQSKASLAAGRPMSAVNTKQEQTLNTLLR